MLATTHFAVTTSLLLLARQSGINLTREAIILSYIFGNLIDLDHLIFYPRQSWRAAMEFITARGQKPSGQYHLHSKFQEPSFAAIIWLFALGVWFWVGWKGMLLPAVCLTLHIALDAPMRFKNYLFWPFSNRAFHGWIPSNSRIEYIVSLILVAFVIYFSFKTGLFNL